MTLVTATEWGISYTTGSNVDGAILSVHKLVNEPNEFGGIGVIVNHHFDGLNFTSIEDAQEYVPAHGMEEFNALLDSIILQEIS